MDRNEINKRNEIELLIGIGMVLSQLCPDCSNPRNQKDNTCLTCRKLRSALSRFSVNRNDLNR